MPSQTRRRPAGRGGALCVAIDMDQRERMEPIVPGRLQVDDVQASLGLVRRHASISHGEDGMKKLALQMEDLRVESFETSAAREGHGTVRGAEAAISAAATDCPICTRVNCGVPSEQGYATFVNGHCIRCI
jgi:hypothetical protein